MKTPIHAQQPASQESFELATLRHQQGRLAEAERIYRQILGRQPNHFGALHLLGIIALQTQHTEQAVRLIRRAIALDPSSGAAHSNLGKALIDLNRPAEALASLDKAITLDPDLPEAHNNRGRALECLRRYKEALASYDKAIALSNGFAEAHNNRGNALCSLRRYDEALSSYDKALSLNPNLKKVYHNLGGALSSLKRHEEAASAYAIWLRFSPQDPFIKGKLLHQKMLCCDWKELDQLVTEIDSDVSSGRLSADPFGWQAIARSPKSLQLCAEIYSRNNYPAKTKDANACPSNHYAKIRVGYLSGEFRSHATSYLLVGVLEAHDKAQFEVYGIDNGWDDKSEIRRRINASVHSIIDIHHLSDSAAAAAISESRIDILINLNGYFGNHRMGVFAQKPAPIQVNYLGFPGTLGASYIDYIIADQYVIPPDSEKFYAEKVVYLPDSYQANDAKREVGSCAVTRRQYRLPQSGFVFCCFNNSYKITPEMFDCWMQILDEAKCSVLWLLEGNASAVANLRVKAASRGINPERLVFAKRIAAPEHLARHHLADLFLDTLPCNAHTTASDALWAGLPVLTLVGETFAGRIGASLLNSIGLPELITTTPQAYKDLAVELAGNSEKLASIKRKLAGSRLTSSLFDTKLFTRRIEAAYQAMYERYRARLAPDHIQVPP